MNKPDLTLRPPPSRAALTPDDWVARGPAGLAHLDGVHEQPSPPSVLTRRDGSKMRKRSIYLSPSTDAELAALCRAEGRTVSAVLNVLVEAFLGKKRRKQ